MKTVPEIVRKMSEVCDELNAGGSSQFLTSEIDALLEEIALSCYGESFNQLYSQEARAGFNLAADIIRKRKSV